MVTESFAQETDVKVQVVAYKGAAQSQLGVVAGNIDFATPTVTSASSQIQGRTVTALGQTDEPQGWREEKAAGGCVIDVRSGEIVSAGLSMPHSPRWHDDRLWVLESGRGSIATVDVSSGAVETVIELPGFTRGLALADSVAVLERGALAYVGPVQGYRVEHAHYVG